MNIQTLTKTWHWMRFGALVLMVTGAIVACQTPTNQSLNETISTVPSDPANCRTVQHEMGETEICGQPQRIVVFGPGLLEALLALDIQPIGYAPHLDFFPGDYIDPAQQIPYVGDRITQPLANVGTMRQPSIEAILKVKPDLIIAIDYNDDIYATLSQIAPTLLLSYPEPSDTDKNLRAIARAVDRTEQAEQLIVQAQQQIVNAQAAFASLVESHPKVLLLSSSQLQEIELISSSTLCGSLIEEFGFQLVFPPEINHDDSRPVLPISLESLPELNDANLVLLLGHNFDTAKELNSMDGFENYQLSSLKQAWAENPIAQSLDASKTGQVYFFDGYLCGSLPGPIGTELYLEELQEKLLSPS
ncbi:MAG: iron-siderophore ABC transporter substrate-binding protein [Cyanobacteria bacterium P01_B01_bin.77]